LYDSQVVYNFKYNTWSIRFMFPSPTCYGVLGKRARTTDELVGTNDGLYSAYGSSDQMEETEETGMTVWGGSLERVWRDEIAADTSASLETTPAQWMETGDLIYGSAQVVKQVSAMTINATATLFNGLKVYVSVRERFDDTVTFKLVGTWTADLSMKMLTFPPESGKVLRYAFEPILPVRGFVFRGYEDNVLNAGAYR
jgi:hypothetical protein